MPLHFRIFTTHNLKLLTMRKITFIIMLSVMSIAGFAQITIDKNDMPVPNDTFRISTAANASSFNFKQTGTNFTWDFTGLQASSQKMESYVSISSTPAIYNLVFMYPFVATIARERPDANIGTISITEGYNFYKNTSSEFKEVGFGAKIQGAPIPVQYQSPDIIYRFPMNYGNTDSCDAAWHVNVPSLGYISEKKHRVNEVDGWGTVKTPYGTFSCLRIKSVVLQEDSFHYDSIPLPFPSIPSKYTEYIWLAKNTGFPIVKATERMMNTTVEYIDSIKSFAGFGEVPVAAGLNIFPNPASAKLTISFGANQNSNAVVRIYSVGGKEVYRRDVTGKNQTTIDVSGFEKGVYFISVITPGRLYNGKVMVE
jgi:hypothetical protein